MMPFVPYNEIRGENERGIIVQGLMYMRECVNA